MGYLTLSVLHSLRLVKNDHYDIEVKDKTGNVLIVIKCVRWLNDYDKELASINQNRELLASFFEQHKDIRYLCLYASRLKSGLIEYKNTIFSAASVFNINVSQSKKLTIKIYNFGLFESMIHPYSPVFITGDKKEYNFSKKSKIGDFEIEDDVLIQYTGQNSNVVVPKGVKKLGNGVFWNCASMKSLTLPDGLTSLGGDTFYNCANLVNLNIPSSVEVMGDNPFANCQSLTLVNNSPHFVLEDGALLNKQKTRLIYYSIKNGMDTFVIPNGVISIGKHAFYSCKSLQEIIIPETVAIMENNPFSDCPHLTLVNRSPNFILENGGLYNKPKTTFIYYAINNTSKSFSIAEGVTIIGRHSFYNCHNLLSVTIPSSVKIIGYNPFAHNSSLSLINKCHNYIYKHGALYDKLKTELIYYSICNPSEDFIVPNTVKIIGRSAFLGCPNLKNVILPDGIESIGRSAFSDCVKLENINFPSSITSLGEWAFSNCSKLKNIRIPEHAVLEKHTFLNCLGKINRY